MHRIALIFYLMLLGFYSQAQRDIIEFSNITIDDGLAQSTVSDMVQDSNGFVWIATAEGLHRYDGHGFKIFKQQQNQPASIPDNYLTAIALSKNGVLYVGGNNGKIARLSADGLKVTRLQGKWTQANNYHINQLFVINETMLGIATDGGGLVVTDTSGKQHSSFQFTGLSNQYVRKVVKDENRFWVCTQGGIYGFNKQFKPLLFPELDTFRLQFVTDICHVTDSSYYISTMGQGIFYWNMHSHKVMQLNLPRMRGSRYIKFLLTDNMGEIWAGTSGGGLLRMNNQVVNNYYNNPMMNNSLVGDEVNCGLKDSEGNLWFGTISGISCYNRSISHFSVFKEFFFKGDVLNNNVYCIYPEKGGNVWLGTLTGGMLRYSISGDSIDRHYPVIKSGKTETKAIRSMLRDSKGNFWIGTRDKGLFLFDQSKETFRLIEGKNNQTLSHPVIRCVFEDSKRRLWIGTGNGVNLFVPDKEAFYPISGGLSAALSATVYDIKENRDKGELLVATFRGGLQLINPDNGNFRILKHNGTRTGPSSDNLMCIEEGGNGLYYIGTYGGGLCIYDTKADTFGSVTEKDGLPNNVVYGILKEKPGVFWLSTNHGICRYNSLTGKVTVFGREYYLQSLEYNEGAYCKTNEGKFFFGGIRGINYFNPHLNYDRLLPQHVLFTGLKIFEKNSSYERDIVHLNELTIPYNAGLISFDFASPGYAGLNNIVYAYRMQGYDKDWIESGKRHTAFYTRLSPGNYTLQVKAKHISGLWEVMGKPVKIIVPPPFWLQWWFISLLTLAGIGLILLIIRTRTRIISRRFKQKQVELELQALRSQMNPHFIFNSLNSIQYYILQKDPPSAYTYLTKFSTLMRMILHNSRERFISLKAEKEWLELYLELEKLRMDNELEYSVEIEGTDEESTWIPTMLIQPFAENAIVHGLLPKEEKRKLVIRFKASGNQLVCTVVDNGIGRAQSEILNQSRNRSHQSAGMKITGERLEMLGTEFGSSASMAVKDLMDNAGKPCGTEVTVIIPLIKQLKN